MAKNHKKMQRSETCVVKYMRFSSERQNESSIEYQDAETDKWCEAHGFTVIESYIDRGYTGTNDRRPEFKRMIEDLQSEGCRCGVVLVYDYSRFSRNTYDAFYYLKILRDLGVYLISVKEDIDYKNEFALMQQFFVIAKNEQDSVDLGRRVMSNKLQKALRCENCGGKPPLGFTVGSDKHYEILPEEASLVRLIFMLTRQGRSYDYMAKYLNDNGYRTKLGKEFTYNSFHSILRQVKYTGIYRWNRTAAKDARGYINSHKEKDIKEQVLIPEGCPQIIPRKLFDDVQKLLESRANGKAANKNRRHYLLGGMDIIHCAGCGRAMVGATVKSHGIEYEVYRCPNHKHKTGCSTVDIRAEYLNPFVIKAIVKNSFKRDNLKTVNRILSELDSTSWLRSKKKRLENAIQQILNAIENNCTEALQLRLKNLEYELEEVTKEIKNKSSIGLIEADKFLSAKHHIVDYMLKYDSPDVRELIFQTVKDIRVGNDDVTIELCNVI